MSVKRDEKGRWCVDVTVSGQRYRRISPVQTRKGAERYEGELKLAVLSGLLTSTRRSGEETTFRDWAKEWLEVVIVPNSRYTGALKAESVLRCHLVPEFGEIALADLGTREIERFKAAKVRDGLKPQTVNTITATLRRCLKAAVEFELLDEVPTIRQLKTEPRRVGFLDFDEADRLLAAAEAEPLIYPMVLTALRTGLRQGELRALKWSDLDLVKGELTVRRTVFNGRFVPPKSNRFRTVPLSPELVRVLKEHRHLRGEFVFCHEDGQRIRHTEANQILGRLCRRAGLRWRRARRAIRSLYAAATAARTTA